MKYHDFINTVSQHQTDRIKPLSIPHSCSPAVIPKPFVTVIPEVLSIMEDHFLELSQNHASIAIFGLQPVCFPIQSHAPITKNRVH